MKFAVALLALDLLLFLAGPILAQNATVPKLPPEIFFRDPELTQMELSPDGRHVALIASDKKKTYLAGIDLETGKRKAIVEGDVYHFRWLTSERLLYLDGGIGFGGLFAINRDGTEHKLLLPPLIYQIHGPNFRLRIAKFLSLIRDDPQSMLIAIAEINPYLKSRLRRPEVRRLNFFTGKSSIEEKNPGNIVSWLADHQGSVRAAVALDDDKYRILYRSASSEPWRAIYESALNDSDITPLAFDSQGQQLYVAARNGKSTSGLFLFNPEARRLGRCLWQDDVFDLSSIIADSSSHEVLGVLYEGQRVHVHWFDASMKALQEKVDEALPATVNLPVSPRHQGARSIYLSQSDRHPGTYYLVDKERQEFGPLGHVTTGIKPEQMAEMKPIEYAARDGLTIHGYLTLPFGSDGKGLPMLVLPHGGPWIRDSWAFDPEVQFLANSGYAVLQMNFRGSTGYGEEFHRAGFKQWGKKMQDDITDGVKWSIDQGIADPRRIAIFGSSYGGYAALMGLVLTPELFRCGISYAGVTDINASLRTKVIQIPKTFRFLLHERIGDYREEKEDLKAVSPLSQVDKIRAPVLLAYGGRDRVVDVEQGKKLAKALKRHGKQYEFILEAEEGHGFRNQTNRINLFRKIESFLEKNLR